MNNFQFNLPIFKISKISSYLIKIQIFIYFGWLFASQKSGFSPFANAHPLPSLRSVQWTASQGLQSLPRFKIKKLEINHCDITTKSLKTYVVKLFCSISKRFFCTCKIIFISIGVPQFHIFCNT